MPSLGCERVHKLPAESGGKRLVVDAVLVGKLAGRHIERAEQNIENRESGGKVLLTTAFRSRVVPAMEDGAGKRTLHPVQYLALAYGLMPELAARLKKPIRGLVLS